MYRIRDYESDVFDPVSIKAYEKSKTPTSLGDLKAHEVYREEVYEDDLPSMFDPVGYVDPNIRIKQMVEAGIRIDAWNHAVYDFENPEEDDDGRMNAYERDDWDDLDMLSEAEIAKEKYKSEMYRQYLNALKVQSQTSQEKPVEAPKEPVVESKSEK